MPTFCLQNETNTNIIHADKAKIIKCIYLAYLLCNVGGLIMQTLNE